MAKTYTITKKKIYSGTADKDGDPSYTFQGDDDMQVSDGYHTMDELYEHRIQLWITLCKAFWGFNEITKEHGEDKTLLASVWRSKRHSDGELCFGTGTQFVLGIGEEAGGYITYHIPIERWDDTDFAETLERAPEWDGHTSRDVLDRLKNL